MRKALPRSPKPQQKRKKRNLRFSPLIVQGQHNAGLVVFSPSQFTP
ncbi:Uncharacterised protein [Vibrio cholerae]|nr:Uncharacterised protein [Vibrio cholerae]CSI38435.1 Uncharacterised protein [Vibrio cholerae]